MSDMIAKIIVVEGSVQGVGFRAFSASLARKLGVNGMIRNCPDYSVELVAEGTAQELDDFIEGLRKGNGWSRVDRISVTETRPRGFASFDIVD